MKRTPNTNTDPNSSDNQQPLKRPKTTTTTITTTNSSNPETAANTPSAKSIRDIPEFIMVEIIVDLALTNDPTNGPFKKTDTSISIIQKSALKLTIIKQICRLRRINKQFNTLLTDDKIAEIIQRKEFNAYHDTPIISAIACAALNGYIKAVQILIKAKVNVNGTHYGYSALSYACKLGHEDIVDALLKANATLQRDCVGCYPLWWPVEHGNYNLAYKLLATTLRANANLKTGTKLGVNDKYGPTSLLHLAAKRGHLKIAELLLMLGADVDDQDNEQEQSPLCIACQKGHEDIALLLLRWDANKNLCDFLHSSPLWCASWKGHTQVVKLLLEWDADKDLADENGKTPLAIASREGHEEVVSLLLNAGADKNKPSTKGKTPLIIASKAGREEVVSLLLNAGADKNKPDNEGRTPLQVASREGYAEIAELLK